MRNMWLVARREFVGRGKSGGYIITTVLMAVILLGSNIAQVYMQKSATSAKLDVLLLDNSGAIAQPLQAAVQAASAQGGQEVKLEVVTGDEAQLTQRAKAENKALLIVEGTFPAGLKARVLSTSPGVLTSARGVTAPLESIVRAARLQARGIDPAVAQEVMQPLPIEALQITEKGGARDKNAFTGSMLAAMGIVMVMYMVVMINGQFVFQGVLEEKVSRVMEVMAATVGPGEMLAGKLIGLAGLGLIQFLAMMAAWAGGQVISRRISDVAVSSITVGGALTAFAFLLMGYVLSAALNAAAASTISRMEDQATVAMPLSMIQVIPFMMIFAVISNPNGTVATVLSMVPVFSQTVMVGRVLMSDVPLWQIVTSMGLMLVTTAFCVWGGGRIYRAAMLMYGAKPSLKQVFGYLRAG